MKRYVVGALIAIILLTGIFIGCFVSERRQPVSEPRQTNVVYTEVASEPSVEYYWVHDGRVYQRDRPGNFYIFEGGQRGSHIQDHNYTIRIEKEGKRFRNYQEADEHCRKNRGNHGHR